MLSISFLRQENAVICIALNKCRRHHFVRRFFVVIGVSSLVVVLIFAITDNHRRGYQPQELSQYSLPPSLAQDGYQRAISKHAYVCAHVCTFAAGDYCHCSVAVFLELP